MKYPWIFVGAKVVCVDVSNNPGRKWNGDIPVEGSVYTVRGVDPTDRCVREKGCVILLEEIRNSTIGGGYAAHRFRPLIDTSKQVEAMRSLMLKATTRGKVDA